MTWIRIAANGSMGIEAQDLLRWGGIPVAVIKKRLSGVGDLPPHWECSLLECSGISTRQLIFGLDMSREEVQGQCEEQLNYMGWERDGKRSPEEKANVDLK